MPPPPQEPTADPPTALTEDPIDPLFTDDLLHALAVALPSPEQETDEQKIRRHAAAVIALRSLDAQEPVEAMLATHAVLAHYFTLECYRRAARSSQTSPLNTRLLGTAAVLSRTMSGSLNNLRQRQDGALWAAGPGAP